MDIKHMPLSRILIVIATVAGLLIPLSNPKPLQALLIPLLSILMFLSVKHFHYALPTKKEVKMSLQFMLVNYGLLSVVYILLGWFVIDNPLIRAGFWILAIMPPALSIVPFSAVYKGNIRESLFAGTVSLILTALLVPIVTRFVFGAGANVGNILEILIFVLIIPFILGIAVQQGSKTWWFQIPFEKYLIPVGNALIFFVLVAVNRHILFSNTAVLKESLVVIGLLLLGKILVNIWVYYIFRHAKYGDRVDALLFSSFKNTALSATIILVLFDDNVALLPITWDIILFVIQLFFIEILFIDHMKHRKKQSKSKK